jgi:Type IV secretion system pilin
MSSLLYILAATNVEPGALPKVNADSNSIQIVLSTVFVIIGAVALLIIVVSGFRYITSGGEADKIAKAKNGVVYALVGLVIAISAQAIVSYVARRL